MKVRVYYADTDAAGVAYYANYLRWMEMARYDFMAGLGFSVAKYARQGCKFAVVRVEIDYLRPAALGDDLQIEISVERVRHVRFTLQQRVVRASDNAELAKAIITLACLDSQGKLQALPDELAQALRRQMPA